MGLAGHNREEIVAGFLHDVVEDTNFTFKELQSRGIDDSIIDALQLLTHRKDSPYEEYVDNIAKSGNSIALHVKYNDFCHNLKRGRAGDIGKL